MRYEQHNALAASLGPACAAALHTLVVLGASLHGLAHTPQAAQHKKKD